MKSWFLKNRLWVGLVLIVVSMGYFTFGMVYYFKDKTKQMTDMVESPRTSENESGESKSYINEFNEGNSDSSDKSASENEKEVSSGKLFDEYNFVFRGEKKIAPCNI